MVNDRLKTKYKYAVVDLEATTAGTDAQIIQIGIVIIENGKITQKYACDVNPHEPLDSRIIDLTGITDQRLAQAPDFGQIAGEIYELIQDAIFVAHNVKFDANLLSEQLFWEGYELRTPRVDTVELAQLFFPRFDRYNLGYLSQVLGLDLEDAHTAIADAVATAQLFLLLQKRMRALPYGLLETIQEHEEVLPYETSLAIQEVLEEGPSSFEQHGLVERHGFYLKSNVPWPQEKKLSQDFAHNLALLELEERKQQVQFSDYIAEGLEQTLPVFVQAQMGVGKTYAYLLTLLAKSSEGILVAVPTKLLQDQIMSSEGQQIQERFGISFTSLKSPKNYLSLDQLYERMQVKETNRLHQRFKLQLLVWLTETQTGDLDEIGQLQRYQPFADSLRHQGQLASNSLFSQEDFWLKSQEAAKKARVVVTNHAYLLTRLEDDPSILDGRILVVDEAQRLFLSLENLARRSAKMSNLILSVNQAWESANSMVQKRLIESIRFELNHAHEAVGRKQVFEFDKSSIQRLKLDLSELEAGSLPELEHILSGKQDQLWIEKEYQADQEKSRLVSSRFDLLDFASYLPVDQVSYFISATLDISKRVSLSQLLGFSHVFYRNVEWESKGKQEILIDTDFPDILDLKMDRHARLIAERVDNLAPLGKPILVLFTSRELLLQVSDYLHVPHLAQYKNGEPANIKKRFDRGETQVVLGATAFWEGVDFLHQDQFIQVITRLPFDNPKDFFVQKLNQFLKQDGKNPFYDYSLPVTILRLRQAMGRVRRRESQSSKVLLLDNRVRTKRYGSLILKALRKEAPIHMSGFSQILGQMERKEDE